MKDLVNDIVTLDRVIRLLGRGEFEIAHHEVKDLLEAKKATLGISTNNQFKRRTPQNRFSITEQ